MFARARSVSRSVLSDALTQILILCGTLFAIANGLIPTLAVLIYSNLADEFLQPNATLDCTADQTIQLQVPLGSSANYILLLDLTSKEVLKAMVGGIALGFQVINQSVVFLGNGQELLMAEKLLKSADKSQKLLDGNNPGTFLKETKPAITKPVRYKNDALLIEIEDIEISPHQGDITGSAFNHKKSMEDEAKTGQQIAQLRGDWGRVWWSDRLVKHLARDGRGQKVDQEHRSWIEGQVLRSRIKGRVPRSRIQGQVLRSRIQDLVPRSRIPGRAPRSRIQSQVPRSRMQGKVPRSRIQGQVPRSRMQGQVPRSRIEGQVPRSRIQGRAPRSRIQGQVPRSRMQGKVPRSRIQGQVPRSRMQGQVPRSRIEGQQVDREPNASVETYASRKVDASSVVRVGHSMRMNILLQSVVWRDIMTDDSAKISVTKLVSSSHIKSASIPHSSAHDFIKSISILKGKVADKVTTALNASTDHTLATNTLNSSIHVTQPKVTYAGNATESNVTSHNVTHLNITDTSNATQANVTNYNVTHLNITDTSNAIQANVTNHNVTHLNITDTSNATQANVTNHNVKQPNITEAGNATQANVTNHNVTHLNITDTSNATQANVKNPNVKQPNITDAGNATQANVTSLNVTQPNITDAGNATQANVTSRNVTQLSITDAGNSTQANVTNHNVTQPNITDAGNATQANVISHNVTQPNKTDAGNATQANVSNHSVMHPNMTGNFTQSNSTSSIRVNRTDLIAIIKIGASGNYTINTLPHLFYKKELGEMTLVLRSRSCKDGASRMREYVFYYLCAAMLTLVCACSQMLCWNVGSERGARDLCKDVMEVVKIEDSGEYPVSRHIGDVNSLLLQDGLNLKNSKKVDGLSGGLGGEIAFVIQSVTSCGSGFIVSLIQDWKLTLIMMAAAPALTIIGGVVVKVQSYAKKQKEAFLQQVLPLTGQGLTNITNTVTGLATQFIETDGLGHKHTNKLDRLRNLVISFGSGLGTMVLFTFLGLGFSYSTTLLSSGQISPASLLTVFMAVIGGGMHMAGAMDQIQDISSMMQSLTKLTGQTPKIGEGKCEASPHVEANIKEEETQISNEFKSLCGDKPVIGSIDDLRLLKTTKEYSSLLTPVASEKVINIEKVTRESLVGMVKLRVKDVPLLLATGCGAALAGLVAPGFSLIFTQMQEYMTDPDLVSSKGPFFTSMIVLLGSMVAFGGTLEKYISTLLTENYDKRLKEMILAKTLEGDNASARAFYEMESSIKAVTEKSLAKSLGPQVQSCVSVALTFYVALSAGWKMTLVALTGYPIIHIARSVQQNQSKKIMEPAVKSQIDGDTTWSSITSLLPADLESTASRSYNQALKEILGSSLAFAVANSMVFVVYALSLEYGSSLVQSGEMTPIEVLSVLMTILFGSNANNGSLGPSHAQASSTNTDQQQEMSVSLGVNKISRAARLP
ncbi:uncharacterized protein LOC5508795 isoform X2 [Nematostella vectensis]|uniref:uncharacterized protein LOC5508795 isoform X2 n=1 Tax=Nematostella vectensis TaxID=45351 RepID=UPI00207795A5|nr:uncharacterized protein LOC5508795 isoform X2 [Nematostella vectensis]